MRAALVAAAILLLAGAPVAAHAAAPLEFGLQDDPVFVGPPTGRGTITAEQGYADAAALGVSTIRIAIRWSTVEPQRNRFTWGPYDTAVSAAAAHGFHVQLALTGPAPAFATSNHRVGVLWPSPAAFATFAGAAAARYGTTPETYSVWNEPNWNDLLQPDSHAPLIYRRLYQAGYAAIRRAAPRARVLIGELAPMGYPEAAIPPLRFLREMFCARCAPLHADGFALHPYTLRWSPRFKGYSSDDVTTGSLPRLTRELDQLARTHALSDAHGRPLDVYLTEYGWHANYPPIPERLRARFAVEGFQLARAAPRVRELSWYELASPPASRHDAWNTGLIDAHGLQTLTFRVLSAWAHT
jgi:hypothetical protein